MSKSLQNTQILGNVGKDVETRFTQQGKQVSSFSVACSDSWKDAQGQQKEITTWFKVTCWEALAEIAQNYVKKGSKIFVEGKVNVSAYIDKEGKPAASLELTARNIILLGDKSVESNGNGSVEGLADAVSGQVSDIQF